MSGDAAPGRDAPLCDAPSCVAPLWTWRWSGAGSRRWLGVAVILASILLVGGGLAAGSGPARLGSAAPGPVATDWPGLGPVSTTAGSSAGPAGALVVPSATPTAPPAGGRAEPNVQAFAQQPGVAPQPPLPSPTSTHPVETYIDGCDRNYGTPVQCVPWTFPAGTTDACGWLAAHGFGPLVVVGTDRQVLDRDGDGIACGAGDT